MWAVGRARETVGRGFESADSLLIVEERPEVLDAASIRAERVLRSVDTWQTRDLALTERRARDAGARGGSDTRIATRGSWPGSAGRDAPVVRVAAACGRAVAAAMRALLRARLRGPFQLQGAARASTTHNYVGNLSTIPF